MLAIDYPYGHLHDCRERIAAYAYDTEPFA
jgi:hypothetical protein